MSVYGLFFSCTASWTSLPPVLLLWRQNGYVCCTGFEGRYRAAPVVQRPRFKGYLMAYPTRSVWGYSWPACVEYGYYDLIFSCLATNALDHRGMYVSFDSRIGLLQSSGVVSTMGFKA